MGEVYQLQGKEVKGSIEVIDSSQLYAKASEGLLSLSMTLGLEVLRMLMQEDVERYAGKRGKHNQNGCVGYRHGTEKTTVVMGGSKVQIDRPRVRCRDGSGELPLEALQLAQNEDPLNAAILTRLLNGISTRKYGRTEAGEICTSKSEASRRFIAGMDKVMEEFFNRRLDGPWPILMLDGMELGKMTILAALGIDADGRKQILGVIEGGSENSTVVASLLNDLIGRGLKQDEPRLYVIDGGKALHKGVTDVFGKNVVIQRCQVHKKRNVLSHLPESEKSRVSLVMSAAYKEFEYGEAKTRLEALASSLEHRYPQAAASLLEGLDETLTVHRLEVPGLLRQTISNTNAMESANSVCRGLIRRVSNVRDGTMAIRYAAAGFLEAERSFRRVCGYKQISCLMDRLDTSLGISNPISA